MKLTDDELIDDDAIDEDKSSVLSTSMNDEARERELIEVEIKKDDVSSPDPEIEAFFDPRVHDGAAAIDLGIEEWEFEANSRLDAKAANACSLALGAYDYLTQTIGLDVQDVFRRWEKVPPFFIPIHVSNRYGTTDKASLFHLLDDAIRAYVFGAPAAAIAMCRAALETVLKCHYGQGQWENERLGAGNLIALASGRYEFIQENKLKSLVEKANNVLHNYTHVKRLSDEDNRTIIMFLKTIKFLIQPAPER